jgi:hypothetical protein
MRSVAPEPCRGKARHISAQCSIADGTSAALIDAQAGGEEMDFVRTMVAVALTVTGTAGTPAPTGPETFLATATSATTGGMTATAPVTIGIVRTTPEDEAQALVRAFVTGGETALRQALSGLAPTGSVRIGNASPTPTRITLDRPTDKGRLLTIVTDRPILFVGGGFPEAKAKDGYGFAVLDIEVDAEGNGSGTLSPAAKVKVAQGAFVVDEYASQALRLTGVRRER